VAASRNGRIGVMATVGTLRSERYARLVEAYGNGAQVIAQPCPGLADLVEEGHLDDEVLRARIPEWTEPLKQAGVDTVVLGCTHYPFVREQIAAALGPDVTLLDSGPAIARQTARVLRERNSLRASGEGTLRLVTTGDPAEVAAVAGRIWGSPIPVRHVDFVADALAPSA
jgi:glutamate racemase